MTSLCRDCLHLEPGEHGRCPACGSPRVIAHGELGDLAIAHIDCDAFYASVEKRDRPELRDQPVIVGGGRRGVVSAACYVARVDGVRSAMPMFKALKACPGATVIKPDMEKYVAVARDIRALMTALTPLVEPLSLDEAFLDLAGTEALHGAPPAAVMARLALAIEREVGVTASVGLSYCKFLAKIASDLDKPRGFAVIGRAEAKSFLAKQPVSVIWGVGKAMQARLAKDGLRDLASLQRRSEAELTARYGAMGGRLARLSHGLDARKVDPTAPMKSVSSETTFNEDIAEPGRLEPILWRLCERVSTRLKKKALEGRTVTLKLKTADFRILTRARSLAQPSALAAEIWDAARPALRAEADGTPFRLIGVGLSNLAPAGADLGEAELPGLAAPVKPAVRAEGALDAVRARFGAKAIQKGRAIH